MVISTVGPPINCTVVVGRDGGMVQPVHQIPAVDPPCQAGNRASIARMRSTGESTS
jgi:hypothetical protein